MGARTAIWVTIFSSLLLVGRSGAQSVQYSAPGSLGETGQIPERSTFDQRMEESPWRLGIFRFQPWLGVRDAQLVNNLVTAGDEDDFTVTVGGGLRAYVRSGPKLVWAAHALPEAVFWADSDDKQRLNGRYGVGFFAHGNRLRLELSGRRLETQGFFSSELQELTSDRRDVLRAAVEIDVAPRLTLLVSGIGTTFENLEDESPIFGRLDRDERVLRAGLDYRFPGDRFTLGVAYEDTEADFETSARSLSNTGEAQIVHLRYDGPRFGARVELAARTLDPEPGSIFAGLDETTGRVDAVWDLSSRSSLLTYAWRSFGFSTAAATSHFLNDRYGARLSLRPARRLTVGLFAELGRDDYEPAAGQLDNGRSDDVTSFGAGLSLPFTDYLTLELSALHTEYDSTLDVFDRDVTSIGASLQLGRKLQEWIGRMSERLRVGEPGGDW